MDTKRRNDTPHLIPMFCAIGVLFALLSLGNFYTTYLVNRYIHALAPMELSQARMGIVLQSAVFRNSDLLPVYGSSELIEGDPSLRAGGFFADYPTGFEVFGFARGGATSLNIALNLASLGPAIKQKKVVISFTPSMFTDPQAPPKYYAGNFSIMHAYGLVFSPYISMELKQKVARRMLEYPDTLQRDPLLRLTLQDLSSDSPLNNFLYRFIQPLGFLDIAIIHLQDQWQVFKYLARHPEIKPDVLRQTRSIAWETELELATQAQIEASNSNPYGVNNDIWAWKYKGRKDLAPGAGNPKYLSDLQNSKEWDDLQILLQVLKELDARPMILSRPINGKLYEAMGISQETRAVYYNKLEQLVSRYQFPLEDFRSHDVDSLFSFDGDSHTSPRGWVYVNQSLDNFYHDRTP